MGVLAAYEGLVPVLFEIIFYLSDRRIHAGFHVGSIIVSSVMAYAFIVDKSCRICMPEIFGQLVYDLAAKSFIAAGPDDN